MKGIPVCQADVAASFQKAVVDVLVEHSMQAVKEYGLKKFAIAGGVASNSSLLPHRPAFFQEFRILHNLSQRPDGNVRRIRPDR